MTRSKFHLLGTVLALLVFLSLLGSTPWSTPAEAQDKKKPKLTLRQMKKKMKTWSRMLGTKCSYCHVKQDDEYDYEADAKPTKAIAAYCEKNFVERLTLKKKAVSCSDCHEKKTKFLPRPAEGPGK